MNPRAEDIVAHEEEQVAKKVREAIDEHFPAESSNGKSRIEMDEVYVDKRNDDAKEPGKINELRHKGKSYSLPVKGKMRLKHEGETIDQREIKLGDHHPIVPGLNTRLIDGNLYQSKFQVRRRPGVYPYRSDSGKDRVEFNTGSGRDFKFVVDGDKNDTSTLDLFMTSNRQNMEKGGYAMMRALGYEDEELKEKWGEDIWRQNAYELDADGNPEEKLSDKDLKKLTDRAFNALSEEGAKKQKSDSFEEASKNLKSRLSELGEMFDRDVNRKTIGEASGKLTKGVIDSSLDRLVKQHTGQKKPPHRFSEKFRDLYGMPDQIEKGLSHWSTANKVKSNLEQSLEEISKNDGMVQRGGKKKQANVGDAAGRAVKKLRDKMSKTYKNSDLSATTETNNILDIEGRSKEITIGGPGGIQNEHALTPETVSLHPSRLGLIDIVKTQVSSPGETMPMASGAAISSDGNIKRMVYDRKLGEVRPVSTDEVDEDGLGFPDEFEKKKKEDEISFEPKEEKVKAAMGDEVREVDESDVRYVLTDETHMFSDNTNIVPFLNHDSGPRAIMGANQMTQALSLKDREKPLVDPVDEKGKTFSKRVGERYNARAPSSGEVKKVQDESIQVEDEDGETHEIPLLKDFPLNQGGFIDHKPNVEEGDSVEEGELLTSNNYTEEDGSLAIGRNLRTAYMPYDGWNYEDAIVMSESGASKMTSRSIKEKTLDYEPKDKKGPKAYNAFHQNRGGTMSPENEAKLGADGVIKEGETVEPGDVMAVSIRPVSVEGGNDQAARAREVMGEDLKEKDKSLTWDGTHEGTVKRVEKGSTQVKIFVKTEEPFREGDKLCYTPDHEVLTERGWVPFPELEKEDRVCTLNPETNEIEYDHPSRITEFDHSGSLFKFENDRVSFRVTPGHKMYVSEDGEEYKLKRAESISQKHFHLTKDSSGRMEKARCSPPSKEKYEGKVYCCTVPTHVLYVRRNGKAAWCGNTGRHGEKGIVSKILPDDEMIQDKDGEPMDLLLDPHGVPSRANPGQIMELAAGKIAKKRGEPYEIKNFTPGMLDKVKKDLKKEGLSDKENLVDPNTGREIPDVATGYAYKSKLKHKLDKKFKARKFFSDEYGYDLEGQPVGGAAIDNLTLHSMIGHNARANLSEMSNVKGTQNSDYWSAMANNEPLPNTNESPKSFKKLRAMMEGLGVNVDRNDNSELELTPMTDKEVEERSAGAMTDPGGYNVRKHSMDAIESSVFDPDLLGPNRKNWNHIDLGEKVPNPMFDKAIGLLLQNGAGTKEDAKEVRVVKGDGKKSKTMRSGFNFSDVKNVYTGNAKIRIGDKQYTGPEGLEKALGTVDVDKTIGEMQERLKGEFEKVEKGEKDPDGSKVSNLHMGLKYAKGLKEKDIRPEDGYMMSKTPVMPAEFRKPVVNQQTGKIMMPSVNNLYRSLIAESNLVKNRKKRGADADMMKEDRERLYDSFGALIGASGSRPQGNFEATGIMDEIASPRTLAGSEQFGKQDSDAQGPKGGFAQSKVVKKKMEASGRSTIIPDPNMDVDEAGIPEEMAWRMYEPFVRKRMDKETSLSPEEIKSEEYDERTDRARKFLKEEMEDRPVMLNRDPSWWAYNVMSFKPNLVESDPENPVAEKAIRVPNLVVNSYFGGDYDGDTMSAHVPASDGAKEEAKKMKPSNHLKAPGSYNLMINPNQSMLMGMNLMTQEGEKSGDPKLETSSPKADYETGKIELNDTVKYNGKTQSAGWAMVDEAVQKGSGGDLDLDKVLNDIEKKKREQGEKKDVSRETLTLDKWSLEDDWLGTLVDEHPDKYARITNKMSQVGNIAAKNEGFTVGLSDMKTLQGKADKISEEADQLVPKLSQEIAKKKGLSNPNKDTDDEARVKLYGSTRPFEVDGKERTSVSQQILNEIEEGDEDDNSFYKMMKVGSKGNEKQIQQVLGSYGLVDDVRSQTVPNPIKNSLSEGLTSSEYFTQQHGAIAGLRDRSVETSKPGDIGKQIVAGSSTLLVTEKDCGTTQGEELPVTRVKFGASDEDEKPNQDILDRVLAENVQGTSLSRGDVVDGTNFAEIQNADVEKVKVRSPLQCEAENGVCQKCFGKDERGEFPDIGENVGIREGQAIVEASTKLTLKSFHTGGASDESLGGFDDFEEVVHLKTPRHKSSIAKLDGSIENTATVDKIDKRKGPNGEVSSYAVHLSDDQSNDTKKMRVPGHRDLEVNEGDTVKNGEKLTKGRRDPNELIGLGEGNEGVQEVQKDVTNDLHNIFENIGNIGRRTAETVTTAMSSFGRVKDPGDSEFTLGDEINVSKADSFNSWDKEEIPISEAAGRTLAEDINVSGETHEKGDELKSMVVNSIKRAKGPNFNVEVESKPIKYNQKVKSVLSLPQSGQDWLPKFNYREIKKEGRKAGIRGDKSPIHGNHPVSAYMYGKEMDDGSNPNHWRY